jgi:L-ribulokinase
MAAAVVAGVYANTAEAQKKMGGGFETTYSPIPENAAKYLALYAKYLKLGELIEFGMK